MILPLSSFGQVTASHAPPNTTNIKHIEGTVARVDGNEFLLKVAGGTTETYQLSPAVQIVLSRPGLMSDLSSGRSVGCATIFSQGDKVLAGECHVGPVGMPSFAQGKSSTDYSNTPTINGSIADVRDNVDAVDHSRKGLLVRIAYPGGATTMTVSPLTKITVVRPGDASALKPGAKVHGISEQAADGTGVIQILTIVSDEPGKRG
jgi:hypothetical protein